MDLSKDVSMGEKVIHLVARRIYTAVSHRQVSDFPLNIAMEGVGSELVSIPTLLGLGVDSPIGTGLDCHWLHENEPNRMPHTDGDQ